MALKPTNRLLCWARRSWQVVLQGSAPALLGCKGQWQPIVGDRLWLWSRSHLGSAGFGSFCLTGLYRCFNICLLFIFSFPNSLLEFLILSSNFTSVLGSTAPVLRFCCLQFRCWRRKQEVVVRMKRESKAQIENRRYKQTGKLKFLGIFQMWWHFCIAYPIMWQLLLMFFWGDRLPLGLATASLVNWAQLLTFRFCSSAPLPHHTCNLMPGWWPSPWIITMLTIGICLLFLNDPGQSCGSEQCENRSILRS